jgi:Zn-dependent peptidase ImmA (M78 family)
MAFKMKPFHQLLSLHPSSNKLDNVIKLVDMPTPKHWGYIDENRTIFVNKNLSPKNYLSILFHELGHFIIDKAKIKPKSEESFAILIEEFSNIFLQNPKLLNFIKQCSKKNET